MTVKRKMDEKDGLPVAEAMRCYSLCHMNHMIWGIEIWKGWSAMIDTLRQKTMKVGQGRSSVLVELFSKHGLKSNFWFGNQFPNLCQGQYWPGHGPNQTCPTAASRHFCLFQWTYMEGWEQEGVCPPAGGRQPGGGLRAQAQLQGGCLGSPCQQTGGDWLASAWDLLQPGLCWPRSGQSSW